MSNKYAATKFDRFVQAAAPFMAAAAVGVLGLQLYSCTADSVVMKFDDVNNADRCLSDVLENKGTLRLPLPQWKDGATDRLTVYWSRGIAEKHAAMLTPEVIAQCEDATGQRRNAAWDNALALRATTTLPAPAAVESGKTQAPPPYPSNFNWADIFPR